MTEHGLLESSTQVRPVRSIVFPQVELVEFFLVNSPDEWRALMGKDNILIPQLIQRNDNGRCLECHF